MLNLNGKIQISFDSVRQLYSPGMCVDDNDVSPISLDVHSDLHQGLMALLMRIIREVKEPRSSDLTSDLSSVTLITNVIQV